MKSKFSIGDKVQTADGEVCEVLSINQDSAGFTYKLKSRDVDLRARQIIDGVKTVKEIEIKAAQE